MIKGIKRPKSKNNKRQPKKSAKPIVEFPFGINEESTLFEGKNPAAVLLGRMGGLKGGKARAASLSSERRSEIARIAAKARWAKK